MPKFSTSTAAMTARLPLCTLALYFFRCSLSHCSLFRSTAAAQLTVSLSMISPPTHAIAVVAIR